MSKEEKILQAALKLFVELGFHGTPTSKIAQEAGVSNGTLFHYYKTKDELVVALYIYIKENLASCVPIKILPGETMKASFKRQFITSMDWGLEHPMEFRFTQQFMSSPYLSMISQEVIQKQTQPYLDLIQEAINVKVLKPLPADFLFTLLSSHLYGLNDYLMKAKLSREKQDEIIFRGFDLIWEMLT